MRSRAALLLPALLFAALHLRTLDYGFVWVDQAEIVGGSVLRPPGQILAAFGEPLQATRDFATRSFSQPYYRPLQVVVASAIDASFGRAPRSFRAVSLALGAATAALFGALALALLRQPAPAVFAGAVFAAHPALLEIYVWISGLSAALMGFFLIASLGCGLQAMRAGSRAGGARWGAASLLALALGLLSKENAAVVPALQLVLAMALMLRARDPDEPFPHAGRLAWLVGGQALLAAGFLFVLRPAVLGTALTGALPIGGSLATQWQTSLAQWPAQLFWLFLPLHSSTSDALRVATGWSDPATLAGIALLAGSGVACVALLRRGHPLAAAALAWIWIAFLPTSGLVPLLHARAERNLFVSLFGVALWLGCALAAARARPGKHVLATLLAALLVAGLAQRTLARTPDWRSTQALFETDVARDPRHREGRLNLIVAYLGAGRPADAKRELGVLAAQDPAREGWHSFLFDASLRELVCIVNSQVNADADTLRLYPPAQQKPAEVWLAPGFQACFADALARVGRCQDALPIYNALYLGTQGDERLRFARGAAHCAETLGQAEQIELWNARLR